MTHADPDDRDDLDEAPVAGSCGRALPHVDVVILDANGAERPDGEVGEVAVRATSPGPGRRCSATGTSPTATDRDLHGGLLRTGERDRLDEDGNLFLDGATGAGPPAAG